MAKSGFIADLNIEVDRLRHLNPVYDAFADHIAKLVDNFDTKAIAQFVQPYLE
jgi:nicotinate-nucleotide pyrophosphorylase